MKNQHALAGFVSRFQEILDALDEFEKSEELDELNAQLEDTIFLIESFDEDDDDEELQGAIDELNDLVDEYRELAEDRPELNQKVLELQMAVQMAAQNLG